MRYRFVLPMLLVGCSVVPEGDDFPDLVVANDCDEPVAWRSASRDYWSGDLAPHSTIVLSPAEEDAEETIVFVLPSAREVSLSGIGTIALTSCTP